MKRQNIIFAICAIASVVLIGLQVERIRQIPRKEGYVVKSAALSYALAPDGCPGRLAIGDRLAITKRGIEIPPNITVLVGTDADFIAAIAAYEALREKGCKFDTGMYTAEKP